VNEKRVDLKYDDANFLRELRRFSNLAGTQGVANTFYDYDCGGCAGRVKSIHHRKASDNSVLHDLDFERDELGNIKKATDAEGTHLYTYDALRRLKTATHSQPTLQPNEFYNYDAVGNRLSSHLSSFYAYSYQSVGKGNRLMQDDQYTYQYDDEGNLIRETERVGDSYSDFTYDHRNRLIKISKRKVPWSVGEHIEYQYDSLNRRIRITDASSASVFIYDEINPAIKMTTTGLIRSRRMYQTNTDAILADQTEGITRWFITDQVGSVRNMVSNDSININRYVYDSFGQLLAQSNASIENDLLFTGREFNEKSFGYFRARAFNSNIGRFTQEDPINPFQYSYALNNPLVYTDPTGTTSIPTVGAILAAYLAITSVVSAAQFVIYLYNQNSGIPVGGFEIFPSACINGRGEGPGEFSAFEPISLCIYENSPRFLWIFSGWALIGASFKVYRLYQNGYRIRIF
jgi:RHS repeat-associated protein